MTDDLRRFRLRGRIFPTRDRATARSERAVAVSGSPPRPQLNARFADVIFDAADELSRSLGHTANRAVIRLRPV